MNKTQIPAELKKKLNFAKKKERNSSITENKLPITEHRDKKKRNASITERNNTQ